MKPLYFIQAKHIFHTNRRACFYLETEKAVHLYADSKFRFPARLRYEAMKYFLIRYFQITRSYEAAGISSRRKPFFTLSQIPLSFSLKDSHCQVESILKALNNLSCD